MENPYGSAPENPYSPVPEAKSMAGSSSEERQWAMIAHLAALAGFVIPFGNIFGPLIVWLMKKDEMPLVDDQGKESLNFEISMTIYLIVSAVLICVFIGMITTPILILVQIIYIVLAAMAANRGERYRYPLTIRIVQ